MEQGPVVPWWGGPFLAVFGFGAMLGSLAAAAGIRVAAGAPSFREAMAVVQGDMMNLGFAQLFGYGGALALGKWLFAPRAVWRDAFQVHPVRPSLVLWALVAGVGLQFVLAEVANYVSVVAPLRLEERLRLERLMTPETWQEAIPVVLAVAVIAPVTEELLFRGLMLRGLAARYRPAVSVGLTSVLFGLSHGIPVAIVVAALAGVVFGMIALRFGSTLMTIAMHMGVNATPLLLPPSLVQIPGFNTVSDRVEHMPLPVLAGAAILTVACMIMIAREGSKAS